MNNILNFLAENYMIVAGISLGIIIILIVLVAILNKGKKKTKDIARTETNNIFFFIRETSFHKNNYYKQLILL